MVKDQPFSRILYWGMKETESKICGGEKLESIAKVGYAVVAVKRYRADMYVPACTMQDYDCSFHAEQKAPCASFHHKIVPTSLLSVERFHTVSSKLRHLHALPRVSLSSLSTLLQLKYPHQRPHHPS